MRGEIGRSTTNEGVKGSGETVKAPIVLLGRSSKDKPLATATLRLPLNSSLTGVYGWLCVSEEKGFVRLPSIYFFRWGDDAVC